MCNSVVCKECQELSYTVTCNYFIVFQRFSAEGTPFYMDSAGIVRMCNRRFGMSWVQVANTKSHVSFIGILKEMNVHVHNAVHGIVIYAYTCTCFLL